MVITVEDCDIESGHEQFVSKLLIDIREKLYVTVGGKGEKDSSCRSEDDGL